MATVTLPALDQAQGRPADEKIAVTETIVTPDMATVTLPALDQYQAHHQVLDAMGDDADLLQSL